MSQGSRRAVFQSKCDDRYKQLIKRCESLPNMELNTTEVIYFYRLIHVHGISIIHLALWMCIIECLGFLSFYLFWCTSPTSVTRGKAQGYLTKEAFQTGKKENMENIFLPKIMLCRHIFHFLSYCPIWEGAQCFFFHKALFSLGERAKMKRLIEASQDPSPVLSPLEKITYKGQKGNQCCNLSMI